MCPLLRGLPATRSPTRPAKSPASLKSCGACAASAVAGTQAECNWKKSYYAARRAQTNDNWAQTIDNTLQAFSVIQKASEPTMQRCCAFAARGAEAFARLDRHWSNGADASGGCCVRAGNPFVSQPAHEVIDTWYDANVADVRRNTVAAEDTATIAVATMHPPVPGPAPVAADHRSEPQPRPHVLLFHERFPSKKEGGHYRPLQLVEWLTQNGFQVTMITRTGAVVDGSGSQSVSQGFICKIINKRAIRVAVRTNYIHWRTELRRCSLPGRART